MSALKKSLHLTPIPNNAARRILEQHHPLGVGLAFTVAIGIYWNGTLEGVMTWGMPCVNLAVQRYGLRLSEAFELRKMWISDAPPRNSESRVLAIGCRLIAQHYPRLRLLLTYTDSAERASAYKGAGWIPQATQNYISHVRLKSGTLLSKQALSKRGGLKRIGEVQEIMRASRRKWVFLLDKSLSAFVTPALLESLPKMADNSESRQTSSLAVVAPECVLTAPG